jgi:hypothetical protein
MRTHELSLQAFLYRAMAINEDLGLIPIEQGTDDVSRVISSFGLAAREQASFMGSVYELL